VLLDIAVHRRRGAALAWRAIAGAVLLAGGVAHATHGSGPVAVFALVTGALCLTLADRAAGASPG
jgi:hypothetical protein